MSQSIELRFDGGTLDGKTGVGYGSYEFRHPASGRCLLEQIDLDDIGGLVTNNEAEYLTLIQALHRLRALYGDRCDRIELAVIGDSQIVLRQVSGAYGCNTATLAALRDAALALLGPFRGWEVTWVPRAEMVTVFGH